MLCVLFIRVACYESRRYSCTPAALTHTPWDWLITRLVDGLAIVIRGWSRHCYSVRVSFSIPASLPPPPQAPQCQTVGGRTARLAARERRKKNRQIPGKASHIGDTTCHLCVFPICKKLCLWDSFLFHISPTSPPPLSPLPPQPSFQGFLWTL